MDIDALLECPYWVIDFLPYQVPADCEGQFFMIEDYFLKPSRMECLQRKFLTVILKLNCYYPIKAAAGDQWIDNPDPVYIQDQINGRGLDVLIGDTTQRKTCLNWSGYLPSLRAFLSGNRREADENSL